MSEWYIVYTGLCLAVGLALSAGEMLAFPQLYHYGGLMDWDVSRMRARILMRSRLLQVVYHQRHFNAFALFRLGTALLLLLSVCLPYTWLQAAALVLCFLSYLLFTLRTPYGLDGSDQAALLVSLIYVVLICARSERIHMACHLFLAAQLTLVYFTSGWNKLKARHWRSGTYLWKLFSTGFYGMENLGRLLEKNKAFACIASLSIVLFETFFFLYWLLPAPYCWILLGCLGLFHLLTAITMGLNTFFWAFLAMYPSTIYCRMLY